MVALRNRRWTRKKLLATAVLAGLLSSCMLQRSEPARTAADADVAASYVLLGEGGRAMVRVVTAAAQCPALWLDGVAQAMGTRAPPQTLAPRVGQAKPTVFAVRICELPLPEGTGSARVGDKPLPLPRTAPARIVVLGDTGCRIKTAEHAFQACDDPQQWPFAAIASAAAREHPDLVIHVGDYHYRESACPADQACANSIWGYGWDAWDADLFSPARPLLQAAPWVVVRGNHEECARAGQGWFRLLDPASLSAGRTCDQAADDEQANFSAPYAVPLGGRWQLIVFDSALASRPIEPGKAADARRLARYQENMRAVNVLASAPGMRTVFVSHHPVLGFTVEAAAIRFGNPTLLAAMEPVNGTGYFAPGVQASLHGHVHSFQAINFSSAHPPTLVAGHGGDNLDAELSDAVAESYPSAPGVRIEAVSHSHSFGYLLLERDATGWTVFARRRDGSTLTVCSLQDAHLACGPGLPSVHPGAGR